VIPTGYELTHNQLDAVGYRRFSARRLPTIDDELRFGKSVDLLTSDQEHDPQNVFRALVQAGASIQPWPDRLF
jgi:hypothetical protein